MSSGRQEFLIDCFRELLEESAYVNKPFLLHFGSIIGTFWELSIIGYC